MTSEHRTGLRGRQTLAALGIAAFGGAVIYAAADSGSHHMAPGCMDRGRAAGADRAVGGMGGNRGWAPAAG